MASPPSVAVTAAELETVRADRAERLAREDRDRALDLAEKRGRDAAFVESRLGALENHSKELNGSIGRLAGAQETMAQQLLRANVTQELREEAAQEDRDKLAKIGMAWTKKQVYSGFAAVAVAVAAAVFAAIGHPIA